MLSAHCSTFGSVLLAAVPIPKLRYRRVIKSVPCCQALKRPGREDPPGRCEQLQVRGHQGLNALWQHGRWTFTDHQLCRLGLSRSQGDQYRRAGKHHARRNRPVLPGQRPGEACQYDIGMVGVVLVLTPSSDPSPAPCDAQLALLSFSTIPNRCFRKRRALNRCALLVPSATPSS